MNPPTSQTLPLGLADSTKFAALLVKVTHGPEADVALPSGVRAYTSWPEGVLSRFWTEGLGEWECESIAESDLVIVASAFSAMPEILDAEHSDLRALVAGFALPLALQRAWLRGRPRLIEGSVVEGEVKVRRVSYLPTLLWPNGYPHVPVGAEVLREAEALRDTIAALAAAATHQRLLRGLRSLQRVWVEREGLERLHGVARALDALCHTEQGKGTRQFKERCQLFTGESSAMEAFFSDLYSRRSGVVHMKGFELTVLPGETRGGAATRVDGESRDAEAVAVEGYRRVLGSPSLLARFDSDASIDGFWALDGNARRGLFGVPIVVSDVIAESERLTAVHEGWG